MAFEPFLWLLIAMTAFTALIILCVFSPHHMPDMPRRWTYPGIKGGKP
jgi:uncharacterized membrane protein